MNAPPCPGADALAPVAASALRVDPAHVDVVLCAAGRFPAPGWFLFAWVADPQQLEEDPSSYRARHLVVLDPATKAVVAAAPVGEDGGRQVGFADPRLVDLDGDGSDEILFTGAYSESGASDTWLEVWRVDGKAIADAGKGKPIALTASGYDDKDCTATVDTPARPGGGADLVITRALVPAAGEPGPGEQKTACDVGVHRLRLEGGVLK